MIGNHLLYNLHHNDRSCVLESTVVPSIIEKKLERKSRVKIVIDFRIELLVAKLWWWDLSQRFMYWWWLPVNQGGHTFNVKAKTHFFDKCQGLTSFHMLVSKFHWKCFLDHPKLVDSGVSPLGRKTASCTTSLCGQINKQVDQLSFFTITTRNHE